MREECSNIENIKTIDNFFLHNTTKLQTMLWTYFIKISPEQSYNNFDHNEFLYKINDRLHGIHNLFNNIILSGNLISTSIDDTCNTTMNDAELFMYSENDNILSLIRKNNSDTHETDEFIYSKIENTNLVIHKNLYENKTHIITQLFHKCKRQTCFIDIYQNEQKHLCVNLYVHPSIYLRLVGNHVDGFNMYDELFYMVSFDDVKKYITPIMKNEPIEFKRCVELLMSNNKFDETTIKLLNIICYACMSLKRYDMFCIFINGIKNKNIISTDTLYKIIDDDKTNNYNYVSTLCKNEYIDFDVCDKYGLLPFEHLIQNINSDTYVKEQNKQNKQIIIKMLYEKKYLRHPKYWAGLKHKNMYRMGTNNGEEYENMTIEQLNTIILKEMIDKNMFNDINEYCHKYNKHICFEQLMNYVIEIKKFCVIPIIFGAFMNTIDINDPHIKNTCNELLEIIYKCYNDNQLYDNIISIKEHINNYNVQQILKHLIRNVDLNGMVFLFEYIDHNIINHKDVYGNNIIHSICLEYMKNAINVTDTINLIHIVEHYNPELLNSVNKQGIIPLFLVCNSVELTDMIFQEMDLTKLCVTTKDGSNYLHYIIMNGSIDVLKKIISMDYHNKYNLLNQQNKNHETPVLLSCKCQKQDMCNVLINCGADMSITDDPDNCGNMMDHYIALYGLYDVIKPTISENNNICNYKPIDYLMKHIINMAHMS